MTSHADRTLSHPKLEQSGIDIEKRRVSETPDQLLRDSVQRVQNKIRASEEEVKVLLEDRAYVARELDALEGEWLQKQAELERLP